MIDTRHCRYFPVKHYRLPHRLSYQFYLWEYNFKQVVTEVFILLSTIRGLHDLFLKINVSPKGRTLLQLLQKQRVNRHKFSRKMQLNLFWQVSPMITKGISENKNHHSHNCHLCFLSAINILQLTPLLQNPFQEFIGEW